MEPPAGAASEELPEALTKFVAEGCKEEGMTSIIEECVPGIDLGLELQRLLAEDWAPGCLIRDCLEADRSTNVEVGHWLPVPAGSRFLRARRVEARVPTPFLPGAAPQVTFLYLVAGAKDTGGADAGRGVKSIRVARAAKAQVPLGDCFSVQELTTLEASAEGVAVRKSFRVVWEKSTLLQRLIEANTHGEQQKTASQLLQVLRARATPAPSPAPAAARETPAPAAALEPVEVRTPEVWEVQRWPAAGASEGCCLPFLSSSSTGTWWLDSDNRRCEGRPGVPRVQPPAGWRLSADGWAVVHAHGDRHWRSCGFWGRRRMWRCTLEKAQPTPVLPPALVKVDASRRRNGTSPAWRCYCWSSWLRPPCTLAAPPAASPSSPRASAEPPGPSRCRRRRRPSGCRRCRRSAFGDTGPGPPRGLQRNWAARQRAAPQVAAWARACPPPSFL